MLKIFNRNRFKASQIPSIITVVIFIMMTGNAALFNGILKIYPLTLSNIPFLISLTLFFTLITGIFFLLICQGKATRWLLACFLMITSLTAYYMDHYGVIIDTVMIDNLFQTNKNEAAGLITYSFLLNLILLGIIPALLIFKMTPKNSPSRHEFKTKLKLIGWATCSIILVVLPFTADYTSFIREHKIVRFYANPTYAVYSAFKYAIQESKHSTQHLPLTKIANDAILKEPADRPKELILLVIGETARADRFSLNGYKRNTNPALSQEDIVSFRNVTACGTSTGVSVPCMFSALGHAHYDKEKALAQENVLDILKRNGVEILWRDNNSDSKGVATRVQYEDFKSPTLNQVCDRECRDSGMLIGLDTFIAEHRNKDILIVLHQMGNHGPEYYRRYPKEFERFTPACQTGELRDCTKEEIDNAYDNAILYTDYFLAQVIHFLKKYEDSHETAMLYLSDHGESLGEHGIYLHAAPYLIAPKEQTRVPAIVWFGKQFEYKTGDIKPLIDYPLSHDHLFCSLLWGFEINTTLCKATSTSSIKDHKMH